MQKRTMPAIDVRLRPSKLILGCYSFISMLACFAISQLTLPIAATIILILCCIAYTIYILMRDVLHYFPWSWQRVTVNSEGVLRVYNKKEEMFEPVLLNHTFCHPYLVVLNIKENDLGLKLARSIVITPWQIQDEAQYRQLRVWLKWWNVK